VTKFYTYPHPTPTSRTLAPAYGPRARRSATTRAKSATAPRSWAAPSAAHWGIENCAHYVRDVTLGGVAQGSSRDSGWNSNGGEDASRIRTKPGMMARIRSLALNVLRANGVQNISLALYANAVSFDQLLALGAQ